MYIETDRLIVRDFRDEDTEALYAIKTDEQVTEYCPDFLEVHTQAEDMIKFIREFNRMEEEGDTCTWRCYAIENKETHTVMGCLSFGKNEMLHEYELGWMMIGQYTGKGYSAEAAAAFAEYFCETHGVEYLIVIMDVDNPASYRTAEKSGFKLFEKRTVYDYHYNRYCDDYYYFRRYRSGCTLKQRYYGDVPYEGRSVKN
ncbi:MAG: GNAT family N-acetyltransferase [Clostridia bacterium]|nr:GNAT family N-acetyltransferase [Clostridia bacterium]